MGTKNIRSLKLKICQYDLIVDAIFGVGFKGKVEGLFGDLIQAINSSGAYIVSVDIPSGLDADSGETAGPCIMADKTMTFIARKCGMVKRSGAGYCGKVIVKDLGFPFKA